MRGGSNTWDLFYFPEMFVSHVETHNHPFMQFFREKGRHTVITSINYSGSYNQLCDHKSANYKENVKEMVNCFHKINANMSFEVYFLRDHIE